jgi:CPA2 family monovalent cation:H+ antiporter-2
MEPGTSSRLGRIAILCGYDHVGETIAAILAPRFDLRVIEENPARVREARARDLDVIEGSPISPAVLEHAGIEEARVIVIALADPFATRLFAERARAINPHVDIVAHAVVRSEIEKLQRSGIAEAVIAEDEVAFELARYGLHRFGLSSRESLAIIQQVRARGRLAD